MTHSLRSGTVAPHRSLSAVVALLLAIPLLLAGAPGDPGTGSAGDRQLPGQGTEKNGKGELDPGAGAAVTVAHGADKVGICHATGSDSRPYGFLSVDRNSADQQGHQAHATSPSTTWKRAGTWNGITHAAGDPKPDLIEFVPNTATALTREYCTTRGSDPVSGISLEKYVATGASAPSAACGQSPWAASVDITVGDPVQWCLRIANTGDDDLMQIAVLDDLDLTPPVGAAGCGLPSALAIDATASCTYATTAVVGTHTNHASVTARGDDSDDPVADTASAAYTATVGGSDVSDVVLDTYVASGTSAPTAACGQSPWVASVTVVAGDAIHWCHRVENTGDDALSTVAVLDDLGLTPPTGAAGCTPAATLAVAGVDACTYSSTATLGTHTLHAAVSATGDVTGDPVGDTASAAYTATAPVVVRDQGPITTVTLPSDITVEVSADSDGYTVGDTITYTYVVTNGGEAALFDVSLSDDLLGDLTDRLGTRTLAPGAETTATATLVALDVHVGMLDTLAIAAATSAYDEVSDTDTERVAVTDVLGVVIDKPAPQAPAPAPRPQPLPAPTAPTATPAAPVPAPAAVAELPRTGADPLPLGVLAASLVFAGSLLLRRTRTT